jgi:hypothetical protein
MEVEKDRAPQGDRRWLRLSLFVITGIIFGCLAALKFIDGVSRERIPTEGLIGFGVFFTVAGLVYAVPGVWAHVATRSTWSGRTVFRRMPDRQGLPTWRQWLWDLQAALIARDARRIQAVRRDPRPSQLRVSATALAMGVTILVYAALR